MGCEESSQVEIIEQRVFIRESRLIDMEKAKSLLWKKTTDMKAECR
jgi:hypothetical protein